MDHKDAIEQYFYSNGFEDGFELGQIEGYKRALNGIKENSDVDTVNELKSRILELETDLENSRLELTSLNVGY